MKWTIEKWKRMTAKAKIFAMTLAVIAMTGGALAAAAPCTASAVESCCTSIFGAECCTDDPEKCCSAGIFGCSIESGEACEPEET